MRKKLGALALSVAALAAMLLIGTTAIAQSEPLVCSEPAIGEVRYSDSGASVNWSWRQTGSAYATALVVRRPGEDDIMHALSGVAGDLPRTSTVGIFPVPFTLADVPLTIRVQMQCIESVVVSHQVNIVFRPQDALRYFLPPADTSELEAQIAALEATVETLQEHAHDLAEHAHEMGYCWGGGWLNSRSGHEVHVGHGEPPYHARTVVYHGSTSMFQVNCADGSSMRIPVMEGGHARMKHCAPHEPHHTDWIAGHATITDYCEHADGHLVLVVDSTYWRAHNEEAHGALPTAPPDPADSTTPPPAE